MTTSYPTVRIHATRDNGVRTSATLTSFEGSTSESVVIQTLEVSYSNGADGESLEVRAKGEKCMPALLWTSATRRNKDECQGVHNLYRKVQEVFSQEQVHTMHVPGAVYGNPVQAELEIDGRNLSVLAAIFGQKVEVVGWGDARTSLEVRVDLLEQDAKVISDAWGAAVFTLGEYNRLMADPEFNVEEEQTKRRGQAIVQGLPLFTLSASYDQELQEVVNALYKVRDDSPELGALWDRAYALPFLS